MIDGVHKVAILLPLMVGMMTAETARKAAELVLPANFGRVRVANQAAVVPYLPALLADRNIRAFLRLIRQYETGQTEQAFRMMNGGELFAAPPWQHPNRKGKNGTTTAAGAYQFVMGTWAGLAEKMKLPDFSPASQDKAAIGLMAYRGILADVQQGKLFAVLNNRQAGLEWEGLKNKGGAAYPAARKVFEAWGGRVTG